jgi:RHS repeat-associated protein
MKHPDKRNDLLLTARYVVLLCLAICFALVTFLGGISGCSTSSNVLSDLNKALEPHVVYYLNDHLGNTHLMTDGEGNVLHEESRYPYGLAKNVDDGNAVMIDYVYTGKELDEETGLVYFGGRYYAPEMGRWVSFDALFLENPGRCVESPLECNGYSFVQNNPVNFIDILGFEILKLTERQQAIVAQALQRSVNMVDRSNEALKTENDVAAPQLARWFGDNSKNTEEQIGTNFSKIENALKKIEIKNIKFDDETDFIAYVYPDNCKKIYVGEAFFDAIDKGFNSKAGVFVHETSHFKNTVGTEDYFYGIGNALDLAHTDSDKAKMNADNYKYFVESMAKEE